MDGFETVVLLLCVLACGFAAARSSPMGRELWLMTAAFFGLMAAADLHDFLLDISFGSGILISTLDFLGWCSYPLLAFLIFFPVEKEGRPDWNWISLLDFLQVTLAAGLAYFQLIYLPRFLAGQTWMVIGHPELLRNLLIAGGLLLRSRVDPFSQARAIYLRVGGVFACVAFLRVLFPGYFNPIYAVSRPALWLLLGIFAVNWESVPDLKREQAERHTALRLFLSLCAAATLLVVAVLALSAPAPYRKLMYFCVGVSVALYILRSSMAEHSRYDAETRLRHSEHDHRVLFESAIVPIVIFEPESERILQANAAACELYGVGPEGLAGASMKDFTKDIAPGEKQSADLLRTGTCQRFESVHRKRDGREIEVLVSSSVIHYGGGKAVLSFNRDITERKRAERALRESEDRYRDLVEHSRDLICTHDLRGRLLSVNKEPARILGYAPEELLKVPMQELVSPDFRDKFDDYLQEIRREGYAQGFLAVRTRSGETRIWEYRNTLRTEGVPEPVVRGMAHDVTERKRAEKALHESEERFRSLVENATVGIYRTTPDGRILMANPALVKMMGYESFEKLAARNLEEEGFEPDYTREEFKSELERDGEIKALEASWKRHDGTILFVRESAHAIRDSNGKVLFYDGIVEDVTERTRSEEARAYLASIVESSDDAIIGKTCEGVVQSWNTGAERLYGYTATEIIGQSVLVLVASDRREEVEGFLDRIRKGEVVEHHETVGVRKDGRRIDVSLTLSPLRNSRGEVTGASSIARDITERKGAQESLLRLRQAVDASGEVVFMTDREGIITSVNPEFTRLYGYTPEEVVGKATPRILKSGNMSGDDYARFWNAIQEKRVVRGTIVNRAKDGRLISVESSVNPIQDEPGEIIGFLAIQRDVTERKQLEQQFLQAQKMEAVGRLAGGVAHDFNNLLTVINGYSDLMLEGEPPGSGARSHLEEIRRAGERASALTRQLLAFSHRQVVMPVVLDLNAIVEGMQKMLRRLIREDIELHTRLAEDLGQVKADAGQVEQVIMNLAVNARDAMPTGGKLIIETANVELEDEYARSHADVTPGKYVLLALSDTGCGMDAETQSHIFEPFYTTKGRGKGTGLGLSTVYGIVKQSGGHVNVYSEVGHGTVFRAYFPRIDEPAEAVAGESTHAGELTGSETVLLAEDEPSVRSLAAEAMRGNGYAVLEAGDAEQALVLWTQHLEEIALLVTDVIMPGMNGKELADRLKQSRPELKVLFISGYTADAIAQHGILEEGIEFLPKPFTPRDLLAKLRATLDQ
jgi:PAS domain S-box-containing protein